MRGQKLKAWLFLVTAGLLALLTAAIEAILGNASPDYSILKVLQALLAGLLLSSMLMYQGIKRLVAPGAAGTAYQVTSHWRVFNDLGLLVFSTWPPFVIIIALGFHTFSDLRWGNTALVELTKQIDFWLARLIPIGGACLLLYARRLSQPSASLALANSDQPEIVLLRAFKDDQLIFPKHTVLANQPYWRKYLPRGLSFEYMIASAVSGSGTFVALGSPREKVSPEGAFRDHVSENWKQRIQAMLTGAAKAIVVVDGSPSLAWEVQLILSLAGPQKLLLVMPPVGAEEKVARWRRFTEMVNLDKYAVLPDPQLIATAILISFPSRPGPYNIVWRTSPTVRDYIDSIREALTESLPLTLPPNGATRAASATGQSRRPLQVAQPRLYSVNQIVAVAVVCPLSALALKLINDLSLRRVRDFAVSFVLLGGVFSIITFVPSFTVDPLSRTLAQCFSLLEVCVLWFVVRWSYDGAYQELTLAGGRARSTIAAVFVGSIVFLLVVLIAAGGAN